MSEKQANYVFDQCFIVMSVALILLDAFYVTSILGTLVSMVISLIIVVVAVFAIVFTNFRTCLLGVAALSVCLSIWTSHWPTHLRFKLAKSEFEQHAIDIRSGQPPSTPCWIGSYRVLRIDHNNPAKICFWTDLHPYGNSGVVHCPEAERHFNISVIEELSGPWHLLSID